MQEKLENLLEAPDSGIFKIENNILTINKINSENDLRNLVEKVEKECNKNLNLLLKCYFFMKDSKLR